MSESRSTALSWSKITSRSPPR